MRIKISMNRYQTKKYRLLRISVFTLSVVCFAHQGMASSADSLFQSDAIVNMELRSDFSAIQKDRTSNPVYHDGELIYYTPGYNPSRLSVRMMARGNFRINPVNCNFPPLLLDFKKNEAKNTIFKNQNRLKLVTPCQSEKDVIDEYTVYKLYNQVTDFSLKVRLVKILYFDTGSNRKIFEKYSFFIEDKDRVAERNDAVARDRIVTPFDLNKGNFQKLSFFQYFIGNLDWFVSSRKNIIIMEPRDTSLGLFAVPYDFDFSEFVDAEYTKPYGVPEDSLKNRRVYKGLCYTDDELHEIFEFYRGIRPEFESIIRNQDLISNSNKKQLLRYIDSFYEVFKSNELIHSEFLDMCETRKDYGLPEN